MRTLLTMASSAQALILALVVEGCTTAGLITSHLGSGDFIGVTGAVLAAGGVVGTAHVVGTQVNAAAGTPTPAPANTGTGGTV